MRKSVMIWAFLAIGDKMNVQVQQGHKVCFNVLNWYGTSGLKLGYWR
jgi:hypothetical protein